MTPGDEGGWLEERYGADRLRLGDDWKDWLHNAYAASATSTASSSWPIEPKPEPLVSSPSNRTRVPSRRG